jgi:hypothetical protein
MSSSLKGAAMTGALLWGGCMIVVGLINLADASYGGDFLRLMSSVYPGADTARTLGRIMLGGVYGFVDGAVAGYLIALLYRLFSHTDTQHAGHL